MRVLLVYPEFPDTYWSFRHALTFEGKRAAFPPLGLLTVSAMLPKSWERRLVDMNVETLWPDDIEWADMVFVSAMIVQNESLEKVVELCRSMNKKVEFRTPARSRSYFYWRSGNYLAGIHQRSGPRHSAKDLQGRRTPVSA